MLYGRGTSLVSGISMRTNRERRRLFPDAGQPACPQSHYEDPGKSSWMASRAVETSGKYLRPTTGGGGPSPHRGAELAYIYRERAMLPRNRVSTAWKWHTGHPIALGAGHRTRRRLTDFQQPHSYSISSQLQLPLKLQLSPPHPSLPCQT